MVRKENKIAIYLDDIRTPTEELPDHKWIIVRSYKEFTEVITKLYKEEGILPNHISFDHDLGDEHMNYYYEHRGEQIKYEEFKEKTGLHCARWFTSLCDVNELDARQVYTSVHSHNPIGANNIQQWINYWRSKKYGPEYANCFLRKFKFKIETEDEHKD